MCIICLFNKYLSILNDIFVLYAGCKITYTGIFIFNLLNFFFILFFKFSESTIIHLQKFKLLIKLFLLNNVCSDLYCGCL